MTLDQRVFWWLGLSWLVNSIHRFEIETAQPYKVLTFAPLRLCERFSVLGLRLFLLGHWSFINVC
jgi:hypothetical protein